MNWVYQGFQDFTANPCTLVSVAPADCTLYQNNYPGRVQASVFLLNGYFDLGNWRGITPYVGAGVGLARVSMTGFTDSGSRTNATSINAVGLPNGAPGLIVTSPINDRTRWNFAWALMAGLSYDVTQNLKLDLGYRYLNMGTATTGTINCLCAVTYPGFSINKLASHDLKIGMRWMLGDSPAPMAMPQYAPGPLVRKY